RDPATARLDDSSCARRRDGPPPPGRDRAEPDRVVHGRHNLARRAGTRRRQARGTTSERVARTVLDGDVEGTMAAFDEVPGRAGAGDDHDVLRERAAPPGRVSLTGRMPPSAAAIAHHMVAALRTGLTAGSPVPVSGTQGDDRAPAIAAQGLAGSGGALPFFDE